MARKRSLAFLLSTALVLLLAACSGTTQSTATAQPTGTSGPTAARTETPTSAPTTTALPTATETATSIPATAAATSTIISTGPVPTDSAASTPVSGPKIYPANYQDDRSTPITLLESLYNAINSKQYARAYSYWEQSENVPPFDQFSKGYADTDHVDLTTGTFGVGAAAGSLYYDVPVILHVDQTDGSQQIFVGCYLLHLVRPEMQILPPYHPMAITKGDLQQAQTDADATAIFNKGCPPG
ncbi:MAG: hypothetical protein V9F06_00440 [Thermomicrobiales bacterium]